MQAQWMRPLREGKENAATVEFSLKEPAQDLANKAIAIKQVRHEIERRTRQRQAQFADKPLQDTVANGREEYQPDSREHLRHVASAGRPDEAQGNDHIAQSLVPPPTAPWPAHGVVYECLQETLRELTVYIDSSLLSPLASSLLSPFERMRGAIRASPCSLPKCMN
jgi:hypothetical protein